MRQSNVIFGALAVAFVVFITSRGSLPTYMSVLFGTASGGTGDAQPTGGASSGGLSGPVDLLTKGLQGSAQGDAQKIIDGFKGLF